MFFKKKQLPLFSIDYFGENSIDIHIAKNLSTTNIADVASFIYLLTYRSPLGLELLNSIKDNSDPSFKSVLESWLNLHNTDRHNPIINPTIAFKQNGK